MPVAASVNWKAHLAQSPTFLCLCWRIARRDGYVMCGTNNVRPLTLNDTILNTFGFAFSSASRTYETDQALVPSNENRKTGLQADNLDMKFILDPDSATGDANTITESEIRSGLWEHAEILYWTMNYANQALGPFDLVRGYIGKPSIEGRIATLQINSLSSKANQPIGDVTQSLCRVKQLGDALCKVNLAGNTVAGDPITVTGQAITEVVSKRAFKVASLVGFPNDHFPRGYVKFETGPNANLSMDVENFNGTTGLFTLRYEMFLTPEVGNTIMARAGCDRLLTTCWGKFNNAVNHQSETGKAATNETVQKVTTA